MLHAMAVSDLTPADRKGNLTQNCAPPKSLQEPQLSMLLCFCTQKDRAVSRVSRLGRESSSHQPPGWHRAQHTNLGAWHSSGVGLCSKEPTAPGTESCPQTQAGPAHMAALQGTHRAREAGAKVARLALPL